MMKPVKSLMMKPMKSLFIGELLVCGAVVSCADASAPVGVIAPVGVCEASEVGCGAGSTGSAGAPGEPANLPAGEAGAGASSGEGPPPGVVPIDDVDDSDGAAASDAGGEGSAGDPDVVAPALDGCDVGVYDVNRPPVALALSGNLGAHDPVIISAHGQYYYFSTGNGIAVKTSPDLLRWSGQPEVFPATPAWFQQLVPAYQPRNIWAPDIAYFGGQFHLYYSVSSFGSNRSCIGHATRAALNAAEWQDQEEMFCSNQPGENQNFNAIDPNVILDEAGVPWMSFGSFWSGIKLIRLDESGARSGTELYDLASRNGGSIEAPFIVRRCGYYYLFVSFGACCQGADSTYNINVGRSEDLLGPYVDRDGTPMLNGGGTRVLEAGGPWVGPGHNAILIDGQRAYNVYHAYAASNGASQLRISELVWDEQGWPISGGP
jgi:arabinan endo-1,5-alpha-L-arabinosidase